MVILLFPLRYNCKSILLELPECILFLGVQKSWKFLPCENAMKAEIMTEWIT